MYLYLLYFTVIIEEAKSLKDKRKILKSIIESIKTKFKISVSEVKYQNNLKRGGIAISAVSSDNQFLFNLNRNIENFISVNYPGRLLKFNYIIEKFDESYF